MFQNLADDRLFGPSAESPEHSQDGAVVGEYVDGLAMCSRRQCPSIHSVDDDTKSPSTEAGVAVYASICVLAPTSCRTRIARCRSLSSRYPQ
jgi:hypothetical protein